MEVVRERKLVVSKCWMGLWGKCLAVNKMLDGIIRGMSEVILM